MSIFLLFKYILRIVHWYFSYTFLWYISNLFPCTIYYWYDIWLFIIHICM